jgi:hypothetical protein
MCTVCQVMKLQVHTATDEAPASHRSGGKLAAHALWCCALSRGHRNVTSFSQRHAATKR